ncbi:MAG: hypothetical protein ABII72_00540 [Parcubacteria group bacterium]
MPENKQAKIALLMVLGIFVVAVAICATIYYWQDSESASTSDNETRLTTHNSSQYSYKFQYDSRVYKVSESKSKGGATGAESDLATLEAKRNNGTCPKAVTVFISTATLEDELKDLDLRVEGENSEMAISGAKATKREGTLTENQPACGGEVTEVVFSHKDKTFVVKAHKDSTDLLDETLDSLKLY